MAPYAERSSAWLAALLRGDDPLVPRREAR
jgi:hypothetical protein